MPRGPQNVGGSNPAPAITVQEYQRAHGGQRPEPQIVRCGNKFDLRTGQRVLWNRGKGYLTQTLQRRWVATFGEKSLGFTDAKIGKARWLLRLDAEHDFDKSVNQLVKKLAYGKRHDTHYIAKQLEAMYARSQVLVARSGGECTHADNVQRFRENLQESLGLLKGADPGRYHKVVTALHKASGRLDHYYAPLSPDGDRICDNLARQGLMEDEPEITEFAQQLGGQIRPAMVHVERSSSIAGVGIGADTVADGCHAEQLELRANRRAELRPAQDAEDSPDVPQSGMRNFRSRQIPQQVVHNNAAEVLRGKILADDADPEVQPEEPVAGQAGGGHRSEMRAYGPRVNPEDLNQPVDAEASNGDEAVSEVSPASSRPVELTPLQLLAFNRHTVELAKLADDTGIDASELSKLLARLTETGVGNADALLYQVDRLQERCADEITYPSDNFKALTRLHDLAGTLEKDIRAAMAGGGQREVAPPPAAGQDEFVELNSRQWMILLRHVETLDQVTRVTGHDDVRQLADTLDGLNMTPRRAELEKALGQVRAVKDRYEGDSGGDTAQDRKAAQLNEKLQNFMGIIENDICAMIPDDGSNGDYDSDYDIENVSD